MQILFWNEQKITMQSSASLSKFLILKPPFDMIIDLNTSI